jgi:hypothetical protein
MLKIRFVRPSDERQAKRLIFFYLKETYEKGGDFLPTLDNAQGFFDFAIKGAECGDPCLVAVHDTHTYKGEPKLMGFIGTQGILFPGMQTRDQSIRSWGSYVLHEYRDTRVGVKLFIVMGRVAKNKGYTRILSSTHGTGYSERAIRVMKKVAGVKEVGTLIMWQLKAPLVEDACGTTESSEPSAVASVDASIG